MAYSMQLTEQIPNDPPRMGAKSATTSNHPSTPAAGYMEYFGMQLFQQYMEIVFNWSPTLRYHYLCPRRVSYEDYTGKSKLKGLSIFLLV